MNYILDYLNSLSGNKYSNLVFSSFHNVQVQDPLSKLIKWLNTEKRTGIRIKSEEDLLIEDFLSTNSNRPIQLNLDEKKDNNKIEISVLKKNRRNPQFPTEQQKLILTELKKVPVYTVVNGNDEIILASPREESNDNSLKWFYKQYYNWFVWKNDDGPVTIGLFFSNKEDAESYLHEICLKDPRGAQNLGLSVKSTGLDTFYYLNRTSNPQVQLKMISDLEELDLLLRIHIKRHLSFVNPKQKYGKNWFKGTPIYILRGDEISRNENNNERKEKTETKKLVFFSKKDVEKTLEISKNNKERNLEIYNFENYLLDLEKSSSADIQRIKFVPSYFTYKEIDQNVDKDIVEISQDKKIKRIFIEKIKSVQRFCKGVIWLVTSDTLPSEENSW
jgi:hypothetical protein|tara:strand:- start:11 stop:1177 length:1167 start_codon:yes stop_codon:yes gene_type:complete